MGNHPSQAANWILQTSRVMGGMLCILSLKLSTGAMKTSRIPLYDFVGLVLASSLMKKQTRKTVIAIENMAITPRALNCVFPRNGAHFIVFEKPMSPMNTLPRPFHLVLHALAWTCCCERQLSTMSTTLKWLYGDVYCTYEKYGEQLRDEM